MYILHAYVSFHINCEVFHFGFVCRAGAEVGAECGDVRPLSSAQRNVLKTNFARLIELIDTEKSGLVSQLTAAGVITGQHQQLYHHHHHYHIYFVKNLKFYKSKMAAAAILKNRKIVISRPRFKRY